ncbi:MAG TPA: vanadium-dependent haloperoxidase [Gemmatimonadales bacterium]|nr:vanadium-dependent haloperoxidase [Gemmatimonadales bacterium]
MRLTLLALMATAACASGPPANYRALPADPELLHAAVQGLTDVIVYDIFSPPQASRAYAYATIAAYEAARPSHPEQRTLAGQLRGLTPLPPPDSRLEYYLPLSSIQAFLTVGRALTFSRARVDSMRIALEEQMRRRGIPSAVFARSIAYGDTVAQHILRWAGQDHYLQTRGYPKYTVTSERGRWRPTPPAYMDAIEPHWAELRPFVLDSASQFRPRPPYRFDLRRGSPFFADAWEVYETGRKLTGEQRAIAAFWDCNPYVMNVQGHTMFATKKISPGGHWMGIVRIAARKAHADFMRSAEAYARTAIALADGFISVWDEKYRSNVIRPETVINAYLDEQWQPLLQTPPFPEYTSGHSGISTAAAVVLTDEFGAGFSFVDSVEVGYGLPPRAFPSFEQAAAEAAISRMYGGIHYRRAIEEGQAQGRRVGDFVIRRVRTRESVATTASF